MATVTRKSSGISLVVLLPIMAILGMGLALYTKPSEPVSTATTTVASTKTYNASGYNVATSSRNITGASRVSIKLLTEIGHGLDALTKVGNQCVNNLMDNGSSALESDACETAVTDYWNLDDDRKAAVNYMQQNNISIVDNNGSELSNTMYAVLKVLKPVQSNQQFIYDYSQRAN